MNALPLELSPIDQRILGALLEKQRTVPDSYPLSMNGLRTACNQASSRDPVSDYDQPALEEAVRDLKQRELVKVVWTGRGSRTLKYHQLLEDRLGLASEEAALIAVLLLRGPQSPGELRTRTERLHRFADRADVESCLNRMTDRATPLVRELERRPGQHDHRWIHLLGPLPEEPASKPLPQPTVDRDVVVAEGTAARDTRVIAAYDAVAEAYATDIENDLARKPFDRWLLERVAILTDGPIADIGCGPGETTQFLADAGAEAIGIDISPGMISAANRRHPDLTFQQGDLTRLLRPPSAPAWGAIVCWYAGIHLAASELGPVCASLARVLAPGGWLALSLHVGAEVQHLTEWFGSAVDVDVVLHDADDVVQAVQGAGMEIAERYLRGPLPGIEAPTDRLYLLARQPQSRSVVP